jgi:hypothetical protein
VPDAPPLQARVLLHRLTEAKVDFVVIGGVAVAILGSVRRTLDLDICASSDPDNLERLGSALVDLQARLRGVDDEVEFIPDARTLGRIQVLTLETAHGWLDVLLAPAGIARYQTLARRADSIDLGGFSVLIASIEDMIAMKEASGRTKDLATVEELKAIRRVRRGDPARDSFGQTAAEVLRALRKDPDDE